MLAIKLVGHVVANVDIAFPDNGPNHVIAFVHSSAKTVAVFLRWGPVFSQESVSLEVNRRFLSCEAKERGCEVNKSDPPVTTATDLEVRGCEMFPFFR